MLPLLIAATLLGAVVVPAHAGVPDMATAFAAAWQRSPLAASVAARDAESAAQLDAADAFLAGPPVLALGLRSDRHVEDRGRREEEFGIAAPLRLPGQRDAQRALAAADAEAVRADLAAARLRVAGELRESVWSAVAADAQAAAAQRRASSAQALLVGVERRVAAGDLARVDALAAEDEALTAAAAAIEAGLRAQAARRRYTLLTGLDDLPQQREEAVAEANPSHPLRQLAEQALAQARAEFAVAGSAPASAPELGLQYQREREAAGTPTRASVRIELRLPIGAVSRNRPAVAAANTARIRADAELHRFERELAADSQQAAAALAAAEARTAVGEQRRDAARERLRLVQRGFELGELPLASLLRALVASAEADADAAASAAAAGLARARLNQVRGVLP